MLDSLLLLLSLAAAPVAEPPLTRDVPAGTELVFEMLQAVGSKGSQRGDRFDLRLAEPLYVEGQLVLPAGTLITAQLREDTSLPVVPEPGLAAPQAEPDQPEIQQETPGETIR